MVEYLWTENTSILKIVLHLSSSVWIEGGSDNDGWQSDIREVDIA